MRKISFSCLFTSIFCLVSEKMDGSCVLSFSFFLHLMHGDIIDLE
jgi:hypothetical protein